MKDNLDPRPGRPGDEHPDRGWQHVGDVAAKVLADYVARHGVPTEPQDGDGDDG